MCSFFTWYYLNEPLSVLKDEYLDYKPKLVFYLAGGRVYDVTNLWSQSDTKK